MKLSKLLKQEIVAPFGFLSRRSRNAPIEIIHYWSKEEVIKAVYSACIAADII